MFVTDEKISAYPTAVPAVPATTASGVIAVAGVACFDFNGASPANREAVERGFVDEAAGGGYDADTTRKLWVQVSSKDEA